MHLASYSPHACQLTSLSHAVTVTYDYVWRDHDMTFCDFCHTFVTMWLSCDVSYAPP